MPIRPESQHDHAAIRQIHIEAFRDHPHSQQTEHLIVEALRSAQALEISLVAEIDSGVVGHIAFSRAQVGASESGWYLLGPVGVLPTLQRQGLGRALIEAGLAELRSRGALGCVLVGDQKFYGQFGFAHHPGLTCPGIPDEYVLGLTWKGSVPEGSIVYHPAFAVDPHGMMD